MESKHRKSTESLFKAILNLKTIEDCEKFFEDICTIKEVQDMASRLETAILLDEGVNYENITKKTGVSAATISRVARCLNYGDGGYRKAIDSLKNNDEK